MPAQSTSMTTHEQLEPYRPYLEAVSGVIKQIYEVRRQAGTAVSAAHGRARLYLVVATGGVYLVEFIHGQWEAAHATNRAAGAMSESATDDRETVRSRQQGWDAAVSCSMAGLSILLLVVAPEVGVLTIASTIADGTKCLVATEKWARGSDSFFETSAGKHVELGLDVATAVIAVGDIAAAGAKFVRSTRQIARFWTNPLMSGARRAMGGIVLKDAAELLLVQLPELVLETDELIQAWNASGIAWDQLPGFLDRHESKAILSLPPMIMPTPFDFLLNPATSLGWSQRP